MNIKCFMVEQEDIGWSRIDCEDPRNAEFPWQFGPGAMWWAPYRHFGPEEDKAKYGRARALFVCVPPGIAFCLDGPSYHYDEVAKKTIYGAGWTHTGEPPSVTATPSIHIVGVWHGWLTNGELVG